MVLVWGPGKAAAASCALCSGMFCCCLLPLLILTAIAKPNGCGDAGNGHMKEHCEHYGFGDWFVVMLFQFLGTAGYVDFMDMTKMAKESGGSETLSVLCFALASVLGKGWLFLTAVALLFYVLPRTRSTESKVEHASSP
mmetsp:Transcript_44310/g.87878  ORF Transcript_44310/g.87878 Transcript_44310/m.87878 type:complete len:139 (+) Transcript_44310:102-518(+)